jgi:GGDEF domain-containing protein
VEDAPIVASLGLSSNEASRHALTRPPGGREASSVTVSFSHSKSGNLGRRLESGFGVSLPLSDGGSLYVYSRSRERSFGDDDVRRLEAIAARAAPALEAAGRLRRTTRLGAIDPATGAADRRSFDQDLAREVERARRYGRRLALVVLELDGGADADPIIAAACKRVRSSMRSTDVEYRIDAGEIALILPECNRWGAEVLYRRLFRDVQELRRNGAPLRCGLAELTREDDQASFLRRALAGAGAL